MESKANTEAFLLSVVYFFIKSVLLFIDLLYYRQENNISISEKT